MEKKEAYHIVCDDLLQIAERCNELVEVSESHEWVTIWKAEARKALSVRTGMCELEALHL